MFGNVFIESNLPGENEEGYTCSLECKKPYDKYSGNICKKDCDPGEYIDGNKCISNCNYDFIGDKNECLENCDQQNKFIINPENDNTKKKCVSSCADYGKYFIKGNPTCHNTCPTNDTKPYFYNSINQYLESCFSNDNQISSEKYSYIDSKLELQPCKESPELFFYYQGENDLYNTCDIFDDTNFHVCSLSI